MSTDSADQSGPSPFIAELIRLRRDPNIVRLARHHAGSRELAEDGLQETFYLLATHRDPSQILNVPGYFRATLCNEINKQRPQVAPVDPDVLAAQSNPRRMLPARAEPPDVAELAEWHVVCDRRLSRYLRIRGALLAAIPASSPDPVRYRALILAVAERLLREAFYGCVSKRELNADLRDGYREWFDAADFPASARYKRLSRARHDLTVVLITVDPDWEVTL